ncbi:hypothetical protein Taro_045894 [Colocasia esculenta]|uniref:Uncharacterized protein n=1 Tax=Colocasia esculenta TaxID=4460 RepID=A0A843WND0_COLES|nr:hypothetical protein [Colocasia esculenta]
MFAEMGLLFHHLQEIDHHDRLPLEEELFCRIQSRDGLFLPRGSATVSDFLLPTQRFIASGVHPSAAVAHATSPSTSGTSAEDPYSSAVRKQSFCSCM